MSKDSFDLGVNGLIIKAHKENNITVIDEFKINSISLSKKKMIYLTFIIIWFICLRLLFKKYENKSERVINKLLTEWIYKTIKDKKL